MSRSEYPNTVKWNVKRLVCDVIPPSWAFWSVFSRNYVWPETGKTREEWWRREGAKTRHFGITEMGAGLSRYWLQPCNNLHTSFTVVSILDMVTTSVQGAKRMLVTENGPVSATCDKHLMFKGNPLGQLMMFFRIGTRKISYPNCNKRLELLVVCFQLWEMAKTAHLRSPLPDEAVRSLSADVSSQKMMSLQGKRKGFNLGLCEVPLFVANLCFAAIVLVGEVGHKVTLPMWLDHAANGTNCTVSSTDNYFVLSFSSIVFVFIFGLGTLFIRVFSPKDIGKAEKNFPHRLLFLVGLSDALNGTLVVFAANGTRTPPYLQAILGNFLIPLTVVFR